MAVEWQEIDKLRQDVESLQKQITRQEIKLSHKPIIRVGKIIATDATNPRYVLQEIGVGGEKEEAHVKVGLIGNDPGPTHSRNPFPFLTDVDGNKYLLPDANRVILVYDNGDGTGKQAEVDIDGNVTFPPDVVSKNLVVAEPKAQFHDSTYPWKLGRLIPGIQLVSTADTSFFLVFQQGFGEATKTTSIEVISTKIDINHDTAGQIISIDAEILAILSGTEMYRWDVRGGAYNEWFAVTVTGDSPPARYNHTSWSMGTRFFIAGGYGAGGGVLSDVWKFIFTSDYAGYWTQMSGGPALVNAANVYYNSGSPPYHYRFVLNGDGNFYKYSYSYDGTTDTWETKAAGAINSDAPFSGFLTGSYKDERILYYDAWNDLTAATPAREYKRKDDLWLNHALTDTFGYTPVSHYAGINFNIAGGLKANGEPTNKVFIAYPTLQAKNVAPAARYAWAGGGVAVGGNIFFGGKDGTHTATNTSWFRSAGDTWTTKSPSIVPSARFGHQIINGLGVLWGGRAS